MFRILIAEEAEEEIKLAKAWYEKQRKGLGKNFTNTIKEEINSLKSDKVEHRLILGDVRRILIKRFPYLIYYKRDKASQTVKILAVLHHRQEQHQLRARLR